MAQQVLSDGFINLCISTDANFYAAPPRMVVEAQANIVTGVTVDTLYTINSILDVQALFLPGSIMYEALLTALAECPEGVTIEALPRADATGAVAAEYDLTITGPATSVGTLNLFFGNSQYALSVPVSNGDTVATIGANIVALVTANFPYIVTATSTGIHLKAKNGGTVGNNLNAVFNYTGQRGIAPLGVTVGPLNQTIQGSVDPVAPNYASILGECCKVAYVLCSSNVAWQQGLRNWIRGAWDCTKPQCFGNGYTYRESAGSSVPVVANGISAAAQSIVATFDNSAELSVLACNSADVAFGWQKAVAYAALSAYETNGHPELNIQGTTYGTLTAIAVPANCHRYWSPADYTYLQANGFVTDGPVNQGGGVLTNIYIYNDVTEWLYDTLNRPNATFRSTSSRRLATATAIQIATFLQSFNGLAVFEKNTQVVQGVFGTNKNLMLAAIGKWAKSQVGILFGDFDNIQTDIVLTSDFDTSPPCEGVPGKFALGFKYRQPVRIQNIGVNLVPELLDNCTR